MKSCFVLGNGPSLASIDNSYLDKLPTFGSNRIFLKYTPKFYACVNPTEATKYPKEIEELRSVKYVTDAVDIPGCTPLHSTSLVRFSTNPLWAVNEGWSVSYVLLQLAYFYGFKRVYLLGMDHRYNYTGSPNEEVSWTGQDSNHFSKEYVLPGDRWNCPDLERSTYFFKVAKEVYEADRREIINLTEGSALDVFPFGKLEDVK